MTKRKVFAALSWAAVLAICVAIFIFSGKQADASNEESSAIKELLIRLFGYAFSDFIIRKAAHILEFAALGFFSALAFSLSLGTYKKVYLGVIFSFLYAISDEIHQLFVEGRAGQVRDVFIDLSGVIAGTALMLVCAVIAKKIKGKKQCIKDTR